MPPRPRGSTLSHTAGFLRDPFALTARSVEECGDIFSLRFLGLGTWVFLGSPSLLREMFKAPADVLVAGEINRRQLGFMLGEDATFSLDGKAHRARHRVVHPQLNGRQTLRYLDTIRAVTHRSIARWPRDRPFALLPRAHRISLDVLVDTMLQGADRERSEALSQAFDRFARRGLRSKLMTLPALQRDWGRFSPWGRILAMRRALRAAFGSEVEQRLSGCPVAHGDAAAAEAPDMLRAFVAAAADRATPMGREALLDETLNLLFAGHETTGTILTWTLASLLTHPPVLARLREEIDTVVGAGPIEVEHVDRLPYLDAVINESTRYRPIAPMAGIRLVQREHEIGGYPIPPGTIVAHCFPAMCRRRDLFAHPDRFDPEAHFLGRKLKPFEWHPFGGGTRMCIGRGLAELELKVVLATMLGALDLRLASDRTRPVRRGFFFAPEKGLPLAVTDRSRAGVS